MILTYKQRADGVWVPRKWLTQEETHTHTSKVAGESGPPHHDEPKPKPAPRGSRRTPVSLRVLRTVTSVGFANQTDDSKRVKKPRPGARRNQPARVGENASVVVWCAALSACLGAAESSEGHTGFQCSFAALRKVVFTLRFVQGAHR
eukprot:1093723-Rhodomonas_salina.1